MKYSELLLVKRQSLISIIKKYEVVVLPILRFIIAFSALNMLKETTGYDGAFGKVIVMSAIALVGAFASMHCIEVCSIFLVALFLLPIHPIMAIILFVILAIIYILYGRLFPEESILIIITLMAFSVHFELLVPIIAGLLCGYASVIAIILGIMLWFIVPELKTVLPSISLDSNESLIAIEDILSIDLTSLIANQVMTVMIIVCFIVFSTVFIIRKLPIDYGPYIAITIGAVINIVGFGLAHVFLLNLEINLVTIVIQTILFSIIAVIVQFLSRVLDYQRVETVNFEDEDNFYYVRIVPKIRVNFKEKKIKKVYTNQSGRDNFNLLMEDDSFSS